MKIGKILWGLLILGCGVILLLMALGIGQEYNAVQIIGSIMLAGIAITSLVKYQFFLTFIALGFIAYIWRIELGIEDMNFLLFLAAAVVLGIGLSIIFHKKTRIHISHKHGKDWDKTVETLSDEEFVNIESSFGEHTKYIHAENLKRVNIASNFSSVKVYFDQCQMSGEGLLINVSGNFSGIVLTMPKTWAVENKVNTFAASVVERDVDAISASQKVVLNGSLNFAEIKIIHV